MSAQLQTQSTLISPELKTTSLIVAEKFGKRHDNVLKAINDLQIPEDYCLLNFEETDVFRHSPLSGGQIKSKVYEMTRDGFALLVMGFTGKAAMEWKIKFLTAFNEMEQRLETVQPLPRNPRKSFQLPEPCRHNQGHLVISARNVLDIVEMGHLGYTRKKIAAHMKCSLTSIHAILSGHRHSKVSGITPKTNFRFKPVSRLTGSDLKEKPGTPFPKQETMGGTAFDPFNFSRKYVYIGDIAHSLSNLCCFNGHCDIYYSIAEHSVLLSHQFRNFDPELRLKALLYHSPAAYLAPMTSGIRERLPKIREWENRIRSEVYAAHGVSDGSVPPVIQNASKLVLALGSRETRGTPNDELIEYWELLPPPPHMNILNLSTPHESQVAFLAAYEEIKHLQKERPTNF